MDKINHKRSIKKEIKKRHFESARQVQNDEYLTFRNLYFL